MLTPRPLHTLAVLIGAATFAAPNAGAQAATTPVGLAGTQRALALIDSAIVANGGFERLRAVQDLSIRYRGRRWMAYQSLSLVRPWTVQPTMNDVVIDYANNRSMYYRDTRYPQDFSFQLRQIITPQSTVFFDPTRAGAGDIMSRAPGAAAANNSNRRELPAFELMQVRDRAESARWAGEKTEEGRRLQGVAYAQSGGGLYTLWIDAATKRLARLEWIRDDAVDGDVLASYDYTGYRSEKGIVVPTRLIERRNGEIVRDDTLTFSFDTKPADSLFAIPTSAYTVVDDSRPTGVEGEAVRKLADNVWLMQQLPGGNRVMFVAFRDYVLVFEAPTPQSAATAVLDAVRRTVPGKPVRYVTFSHHHDDHGGGLRPYIAEGVTIVTTPTNRKFVEHVASAKHTLRPDVLSASPKAPVIETYTKKRVFTDGDMTVELHDIGPTSHVDEIVLAYLPKQKLVFQGDLLILPARGDVSPGNTLTMEFANAIDRLKLDVETVAGVHGRVGTMADLKAAVAKRRE